MTPRLRRKIGPLIVICIGSVMLSWAWDHSPQPFSGVGREIYVAWRLSLPDAAHHEDLGRHGLFSPYFNAGIFATFSASLRTLKATNALIIALIAASIYRLATTMVDEFAAVCAAIVFLVLFAGSRYSTSASCNFLAPCSHELTHGILLTLVGLLCLERWAERPTLNSVWQFTAALMLGLTALTSLAVFAAAVAGLAVGVILMRYAFPKNRIISIAFTMFAVLLAAIDVMMYARSLSLTLMPVTIVIVVALIGSVSKLMTNRLVLARTLLAIAVALMLIVPLRTMNRVFAQEQVPVARNTPDYFVADARGASIDGLVQRMQQFTPRSATLACVPDAPLINFLCRRAMPSVTSDDLQRNPPDYLAVFNETPPKIADWVGENYQTEVIFNSPLSRLEPSEVTLLRHLQKQEPAPR
jgi:hypothetical protein